jgi:hypothetical protein
MILFGLLIVRLDTSFRRVASYYRNNPHRLPIDFPQVYHSNKKFYGKASQIIMEAAQNPMVQATAVAITGAVVWKALDVLEVTRNTESSALDRKEASLTADKDRTAENERHQQSLAEEAKQRQLDRESNERIAGVNTNTSLSNPAKDENCILSSTYENITLFDFTIFSYVIILGLIFYLIFIAIMKLITNIIMINNIEH